MDSHLKTLVNYSLIMASVFSAVIFAVSFMTAAIDMREDSLTPKPQCPTTPKLRFFFWFLLSIIQSIIMLLWMAGCVLFVPIAVVQVAIYCPVVVLGFVMRTTCGHHHAANIASYIWEAGTPFRVTPAALRKWSIGATVWLLGGFWSTQQCEDPEAQELVGEFSHSDRNMEGMIEYRQRRVSQPFRTSSDE
ncbi:hypothetical protein CORC01_04188 [Colletotrichum orchidophilum]|uniref:Uncharacterized protein n=1 Tax=Colletotrichum orchidophilum TaxID=1209926 RepID=A0A1G4BGG2_9PEZI|nr:uncharacterized protein CORC01_04188 [Colletotrichum orchidophilum]OHF00438.1 hypothetical protein CORC01_04188 [Colletotrichum orchidophilum]